ncbi:MAG: glycosyltransferase family 4 protein [Chloroflexota bacterium]
MAVTAVSSEGPMRIGLLAPPMIPVPPPAYAGTERIVAVLAEELDRRGHDVTLLASGDSRSPGRLIPIVEESLWKQGREGGMTWYELAAAVAWREQDRFDIIHSHIEGAGFQLARYGRVPIVSTMHGRLDVDGMPELLGEFTDVPLVAISESQRRWHLDSNWVATIHHGLPLASMPFRAAPGEYLVLVGRITPEKGVAEAIELSRRTDLPLRIAAKVANRQEEEYFRQIVKPALGGERIEFLGEVAPAERDPLLAGALATLMLGAWPEPFGLVAIESLGTGTPVIGRRAGALTEIVEHGVDGFLVDDVAEAALAVEMVRDLDRSAIRARALERFSAVRMVDEYEALYRRLIAEHRPIPARSAG